MAFVHGKNADFKIDDSSDTLQNLSSFLDSISGLPGARDLAEVTAFGDQGTKHIPGLQNVSFSISGHFDPTASTGPHAVLNSLRTYDSPADFEYSPEGASSGDTLMSGECWLTSYEVSAEVGDKISFSAEFQVNGEVTVSTVS